MTAPKGGHDVPVISDDGGFEFGCVRRRSFCGCRCVCRSCRTTMRRSRSSSLLVLPFDLLAGLPWDESPFENPFHAIRSEDPAD
jgi:hypothetical protein